MLKRASDVEMLAMHVPTTAVVYQEKHMFVYVDTTAANDLMVRRDSRFTEIQDKLIFFNRGTPPLRYTLATVLRIWLDFSRQVSKQVMIFLGRIRNKFLPRQEQRHIRHFNLTGVN